MDEKKTKLVLAVMEFLETSSSESESENLEALFQNDKKETKPDDTVSNTDSEEIISIVDQYNDEDFKNLYKMERNTVQYLVNEFSDSKFYPGDTSRGGIAPSSPENHILSFVWFASHRGGIKSVSEQFKIGLSTCFNQIIRVINFLVSISENWIQFPHTTKDLQETSNEFQKISGFPETIGCISTTIIKSRAPVDKKKIKKQKFNTSVILQAICDYNHKISDAFIIHFDNSSSSDIFYMSPISNKLPQICERNYHILGNVEYHLREYLLTPYDASEILSNDQENYNNKLLATNLLINNTFALLKGRFKQLEYVYFHKIEKMTSFILSCCVLHNICIENNDFLESIDINDETFFNKIQSEDSQHYFRNLADIKRNLICERLNYE